MALDKEGKQRYLVMIFQDGRVHTKGFHEEGIKQGKATTELVERGISRDRDFFADRPLLVRVHSEFIQDPLAAIQHTDQQWPTMTYGDGR